MGGRVFGLAALAAGVFAAGSAGQDAAVMYKKYADKPGDRVRVTKTETSVTDTVVVAMGQEQKKNEKKVKTLVYVNEVVTPAKDGGRALKLKRTYETATEAKDGGPAAKLPLAGKTVVIEKAGDKYTFTADGQALPKAAAAELDNEFNKRGEDFGTDSLFPDKPIKPGDTWDATAKLLKAVAGPDAPFVPVEGKAKVTAKLLKVAKEGGRAVGDVRVVGDIPISELRAAKGPMIKLTGDSGLKVDLTGRGVLDGSAPDGSAVGKLTVTVDGEVQGISLKVTAVVDTVSKTESLKK